MYFDSHAHLSSIEESDKLIERARKEGIYRILNICTDQKTLEKGLELARHFKGIWNAGATTPHDVEKEGELFFSLFAKAAFEKQLVAIGETGLDYHYEHSPRKIQKEFLERYLDLAKQTQLPVIFHCREAFEDLFAITDQILKRGYPAIVHCFTGTVEEAKRALDRGWYLSFSGIVTFKKSIELQKVASVVPLSQLLIETDTPYLAPQSKRGGPNEPSYLPEIARCIAELQGISVDKLAGATSANASALFSPCEDVK